MAGVTRDYRCGYCLCSYDEMTDPRVLPCDHVFCVSCLKADLQIRRKIKCPICKTHPKIEDINSLAGAELTNADISHENVTKKCLCDSCDEGKAVCFCVTCGLKYCGKHQEIHSSLTGAKHDTKSIAQYLEMPGKYQSQTCPQHDNKELIIACENCLKVLCAECDLTDNQCASSTSGNRTHTLRSFSYMLEKLTTQYEEAAKQLADKNKEIYRLEKIVWRQLGDVTDNGEKMIEKIDTVTKEQIDAIQEASEVLKDEIRAYIKERNIQAEEYTAELLDSKESIEALQREIAVVFRETTSTELINESKERQQRIDEATQMVLKKCYLEEMVLVTKDQSRGLELCTGSAVPSRFVYRHHANCSSVPNSVEVLGDGKCVIGLASSLQIYDPTTGTLSTAVNCTGILQVAVYADKVYTLRNIDNSKEVRVYSADLQSSQDLTTVHNGVTNLSATEHHLVLANTETKTLSLYDLNGDQQLDFQLPQMKNVSGLLALRDHTVLVSEGPCVSRYRIGRSAEAIWTCSDLGNVVCMCQDTRSGIIYCRSSASMDVNILSLQGQVIGHLTLPSTIISRYYTSSVSIKSISVLGDMIIAAGSLTETEQFPVKSQKVSYTGIMVYRRL